jgi:hypothetical protein
VRGVSEAVSVVPRGPRPDPASRPEPTDGAVVPVVYARSMKKMTTPVTDT